MLAKQSQTASTSTAGATASSRPIRAARKASSPALTAVERRRCLIRGLPDSSGRVEVAARA
ncbi:hypothetical protein M271_33555 [Streptomyces rapamycinicus NRRL 5491]|nr:hypothetical protein M271_33555 [Streptomyces rapamycinicus NRRL 5491]